MKTYFALALLMASAVVAQNNVATQYKNNFWACVTGTKNVYCTDGNCYTNITNVASPNLFNKAVRCSNNFNADIYDTAYPVTYDKISPAFDITQLDHVKLPALSLKDGETARYWFNSKAEKSAFVELNYTNPTLVKKDKSQYVQMLVFNNRKEVNKVFNMSLAEKVLLPQSADTFTVYLIAQGGNYDLSLSASNALKTLVSSLFLVATLVTYAF